MTGRLYDLAVWRKLRAQQLCDEPLCRHCKARGVLKFATDVDHVTPIANGGAELDQSNLQSLCHTCHSQKTRSENGGNVVLLGCATDGTPIDPSHHWNAAPTQ